MGRRSADQPGGGRVSTANKETGEEMAFGEAIEELESILQRIEEEEIDIDELAQELRKATQLLELCRGKIRKAEVEVTQIVQELTDEAEPPEGES
jgi:exodeoxyribonuclease VII small subunit